MEPNQKTPQAQSTAGSCASTPVTATNAQPGAAQRQGVPDTPKTTKPEEPQPAGDQTCGEGGCL